MEIAKKYNGEILNGDAMQLYAGLPVITNKITTDEQDGIPHHLLGCIGLDEPTWVVSTFVQHALKTIEGIRSRGKIPILVGGTHYYTQSLLFRDRLADEEDQLAKRDFVESTSAKWQILQAPTDVILAELKKVDPVMANRWHPNDRRKISRSLEIYLQTGKPASEIYAQQRDNRKFDAEGNLSNASMRFSTLLFWVHAENEPLQQRLNQRVDRMLENGLLQEVQSLDAFAKSQISKGKAVQEDHGIWVSIGYKEFKAYAQALDDGDSAPGMLRILQQEAIETTKIHTRQYVKQQVRWIRIKLSNALADAGASGQMYLLDSSEAGAFDKHVVKPALDLTASFLEEKAMPSPESLSPLAATMLASKRNYDLSTNPERWFKRYCELCQKTYVIKEQWDNHVKSKGHRKLRVMSNALGCGEN